MLKKTPKLFLNKFVSHVTMVSSNDTVTDYLCAGR